MTPVVNDFPVIGSIPYLIVAVATMQSFMFQFFFFFSFLISEFDLKVLT